MELSNKEFHYIDLKKAHSFDVVNHRMSHISFQTMKKCSNVYVFDIKDIKMTAQLLNELFGVEKKTELSIEKMKRIQLCWICCGKL